MANIGDRIEVLSKAAARCGVVTATSGSMVTVSWDSGGVTTLFPGPGILRVLAVQEGDSARKSKPKKTSSVKKSTKKKGVKAPAAKNAEANKPPNAKKSATKEDKKASAKKVQKKR